VGSGPLDIGFAGLGRALDVPVGLLIPLFDSFLYQLFTITIFLYSILGTCFGDSGG
jgi:hypothetical protein